MTIIEGYHKLDETFSEYSGLKRRLDLTPLEHAKRHFEEHEINNEALEYIVSLFYLTRYGNRNMTSESGYDYISNFESLVKPIKL